MPRIAHIRLLATYNQWMNEKILEAAGRLSVEEVAADRGAFFGSILGTLNHLVVGDTVWLKRFAMHPLHPAALDPVRRLADPVSLDEISFADLASLTERRRLLDGVILEWSASLAERDLDHVLHYSNTRRITAGKRFFSLVMHFFNHQTHHRGQVTTLLSQAGIDLGVTDLLALVPDEFQRPSEDA